MRPPEVHELGGEIEQRALVGVEAPVDPREAVVVAVRVVVPELRAPQLVSVADHRHALREQQRREEIALLALAQGPDVRILGRTLDAAVPAQIVVLAVPVVLAVLLVVLVVVADEVVEGEAVVRGDEVDARVRLAAAVRVQIVAA